VCVAIFAAETFVPSLATTTLPGGEVVPLKKLALYGPLVAWGEWWRIPGSILEHGDAIHLLFNMSVVWTMGMQLERELGAARMMAISVVTMLGASAMVLFMHFGQPTVGASGMILGWAGAVLPIANRQARSSLTSWLIMTAVISLMPGVSWSGHLGGFLAGLPCGLLLRSRSGQVFWSVMPALALVLILTCFAALRRATGG
jgi:membrane associated rhomboid family serine protease